MLKIEYNTHTTSFSLCHGNKLKGHVQFGKSSVEVLCGYSVWGLRVIYFAPMTRLITMTIYTHFFAYLFLIQHQTATKSILTGALLLLDMYL